MKKLVLLFIGICLGATILAQTNQGFSYQAVVRNADGEPLANQSILLQISLTNQEDSEDYYSEQHTITTSPQGVISVVVGGGTLVSGSFNDVPWSANSVFIKVEVDPSASGSSFDLLGSTRVMSVPYAIFAASGNQGPQGEPGDPGEQGPQGVQGLQGEAGLSAYQIWLDQGNAGTEEVFLASLIGDQGPEGVGITETINNDNGTYTFVFSNGTQFTTSNLTGPQGIQGVQGSQGDPGVDGLDGLSAYEIWLAEGNVGSQSDFLLSLVGAAGANGVGIDNTIDNGDGTFTFEYSDGSSFTTSDLTGLKGDTGAKGDKGDKGDPGTGLQNRGGWASGETYNPGDYVFSVSSDNELINSMWIVQSAGPFVSTLLPKNDLTNWVEFQAPQGEQGPPGPVASGDVNETLRHDGTSWVASSLLYNDGTRIAIGNTAPTNILDITGSIRLRTGAAMGRVLTSSSTGVASWQTPKYYWDIDGDNIVNINPGSVAINPDKFTPFQSKLVIRQMDNPIFKGRILLSNLAADFRQNSIDELTGSGIKFSIGNEAGYTGTAAIVAESTGKWSQGSLHFAVNDVGEENKADLPIAMTIDGPSGGFVGIGTTKPTQKLEVAGNIKADGLVVTKQGDDADALFVVRNTEGKIVFAVYESGVRIFVDDNAKSTRGGFAVGGLSDQNKLGGAEYFRVTPDSVRIAFNTPVGGKSTRGGFAVGGLSDQNKAISYQNLLFVAPDSARVYVNSDLTKSSRGGFAVGGLSDQNKSNGGLFMYLTPENYLIGEGAGKSITSGKYNSIMGFQAGEKLTIGSENIFIGYRSGAVGSSGNWNTFLGFEAGLSNTGSDNTFMGYKAGRANLNKGGNVYLGSKAGEFATYGEQNVFIGESTGQKNTYGKKNVFIGYRSGFNTTGNVSVPESASFNVFIGNESGFTNSTGYYNVFIGNQSGYSSSTGNYNAFVGYEAGRGNTSGSYNTFYGYQAGYSIGGSSYTTAIGYQAGYSLTDWQAGTYVGYEAGKFNTGRTNVFVGSGAGRGFTTGADNVAIGRGAGGSNDSPFVAITGNRNTYLGYFAGYKSEGGASNVIIGAQGFTGTMMTGSSNVYIGDNAGGQSGAGSRNVFIGYSAGQNETASDKLYIANSATNPPLIYGDFSTGRVSIGTTTSNHRLSVLSATTTDPAGGGLGIVNSSNASYWNIHMSSAWLRFSYNGSNASYIHNDGNYYVSSDKNLKENISPVNRVLGNISKLNVVSYNFLRDINKTRTLGFIAQEVIDLFPDLVSREEGSEYYGVNYSGFSVIAIKAIQEQQEIIEKLQSENDDLKTRLERLEKLMLEK